MPSVLEHALKELTNPDADFTQNVPNGAALIPIKHLLKALPDLCLATTANLR